MRRLIRKADQNARITLPQTFANATLLVEQVSATELRVCKVSAVPECGAASPEELAAAPLSDRDRDLFLALLDNPPPPNKAFRRAAAKYKRHHG